MKNKFTFSSSHIILLSFLVVVLIGSVLLSLPISSASGKAVSYVDALFTATTSTCVTGLVTVPTFSTWSFFGQVVILVLIQIGGLGVITIVSSFMILLNKKMSINDRMLIQDAFNLNSLSGITKFIKRILVGTFIIEGIGALLYMFVFVPEYGLKGVWFSVFNSISAFCNAGIDVIGNNSLCNYATNPIINFTTCFLIIFGGIGFIVWWDVIRVIKTRSSTNIKISKHLTLHSKIAIFFTLFLIIFGALLIFVFEYNNPATIAELSLFDKLQVSIFQSVTTRTAGFASVPQENLTNATTMLCLILMFIGGSPVGTAGGVKTVTVFVLLVSTFATIKNKNQATAFKRTISASSIRKSIAITVTFLLIMFSSVILISASTDISLTDALYESVSATATVGLSRNVTSSLNIFSKIVIIFTMYLGRVGPISLAIALSGKGKLENIITNPVEDIVIG